MTTAEIANRLVELCKQFKNFEAMETLYADDIVSVEPNPGSSASAQFAGKANVIKKSAGWAQTVEIHGGSIEGPFLSNNQFGVIFDFEYTPKATGQRVKFREIGLYSVAGGKITREEFFIAGGGTR
jgi:ketosteroid isomerase-like protein